MTANWDDHRLETALGALAASIDVGPDRAGVSCSAPADCESPARPRWHRLAVAAALVALVVSATLVAAPGARRAVARWFGIGNVTITRSDDTLTPEGRPTLLDGVALVDMTSVRAELGPAGDRLGASELGPSDAAGRPPEGGVVVSWTDDAVTLWAISTADGPLLEKLIDSDGDIVTVPSIGTDVAVVIDGPHVLTTPVRAVAADRLIWWIDGDTQYRLEADLPRPDLIDLARTFSTP